MNSGKGGPEASSGLKAQFSSRDKPVEPRVHFGGKNNLIYCGAWKGGRAVEGAALEKPYPAKRDRGFKSHPFRI